MGGAGNWLVGVSIFGFLGAKVVLVTYKEN